LIAETDVDRAVTREIILRLRLGLFDPPEAVPFSKIGIDQNDTPEHRALALKVAQESIVLLKNDGVLPLDRGKYKKIAVIGPNADAAGMQIGNYAGKPANTVTILDGIKKLAGDGVAVSYEQGSRRTARRDAADQPPPEMARKATDAANAADLIIFVAGLDAGLEKEEGSARSDIYQDFDRGDRVRIELPAPQIELIRALHATGKPLVLVNCSGSAMAMPWENEHLPAIVQAWYPGEEGGTAVAQVLFGDVNPAGRLPVTFYAKTEDLPAFDDYSMANRTYRYFTGQPLFAFGHGLSYTNFEYAEPKVDSPTVGADATIRLSFTVKNTGGRDGDEVAQVYVRHVHPAVPQAKLTLCAFKRVTIKPGEAKAIALEIPAQRLRYWDSANKRYVVEPGNYELLIGGASDNTPLRCAVAVK
jgi:beta-glucosidase